MNQDPFRLLFIVAMLLSLISSALSQTPPAPPSVLTRHYRDGEKLTYHMKASNRDRTATMTYDMDANGVVKENAASSYIDEYAWNNLTRDGKAQPATPALNQFRQILSLDPAAPPSIPNLSQVPEIVGPITDLLTFYADLSLAARINRFSKPGDHFYFAGTADKANSWADGVHTLIGEDVIAFDITLTELDAARGIAVLEVRHVPPANPQIKLPADWMHTPVSDSPNNWVELRKSEEGKYAGLVGKETFAVQLRITIADCKILEGKMDNPVEVSERQCTDLALTNCGPPVRYQIRRQVEIALRNQ